MRWLNAQGWSNLEPVAVVSILASIRFRSPKHRNTPGLSSIIFSLSQTVPLSSPSHFPRSHTFLWRQHAPLKPIRYRPPRIPCYIPDLAIRVIDQLGTVGSFCQQTLRSNIPLCPFAACSLATRLLEQPTFSKNSPFSAVGYLNTAFASHRGRCDIFWLSHSPELSPTRSRLATLIVEEFPPSSTEVFTMLHLNSSRSGNWYANRFLNGT